MAERVAVYVADAWVPLPEWVTSLAHAAALSFVPIDHPTLGRVNVVPRSWATAVAPDGAIDWERAHNWGRRDG